MHDAAHGRVDRAIVTHSEPQSISRETTFDRDLLASRDRGQLSAIFTGLCEGVGSDLQRKGYAARSIGVKLRYDNFATITRVCTIAEPTQDAVVIRRAAGDCLRRVDLARRIRLIGVRAGALVSAEAALVVRGPAIGTSPPAPSLFD
jgi:DNA polymerase-4